MNLSEQMYADLQAQIPALKETLSTGATYATDLGQRVLKFDMAMQSLILILMIVIFYLMYRLWKWHFKMIQEDGYLEHPEVIVWTCAIIPVMFFILENPIIKIIKAIIVPEWRIIEILSNLIT